MKRLFENLALALASLAVCILVVEVGWRLIQGVPVFGTVNFLAQSLDLVRSNSGALDFDPTLGWRLKENIGVRGSGFTSTRLGIRNNGEPISSLPSEAILAVGDSFTAGSGVRDEETWPAQLERELGRPVLNAAAGGWGVDQMVLRAEALADELRPSLLIVGILGQDSFRNSYDVYGGGAKPWFTLEGENAVLQGVPVQRLEQTHRSLGLLRTLLGYSYLVHWTMTRPALVKYWIDHPRQYHRVLSDKDGVRVSCALLERLNGFKKRYGSDVVVVMFWGAQEAAHPEPYWYGADVVACARKAGHRTLDMHPVLNEIFRTDQERFKRLWIDEGGVLGHPSKEANALTAAALKALLASPGEGRTGTTASGKSRP